MSKQIKFCPFCGNKNEEIVNHKIRSNKGTICNCNKCKMNFTIDPIITKDNKRK